MNTMRFFNKYNIAPAAARKVGLFNASGQLVKTFELGSLTAQHQTPLYKFGVLADTHQNPSQASTDENLTDLQNALSVLSEDEGVDCICILGDMTNSGCSNATQISKYAEAIQPSNIAPTYALAGNHDCTSSGFTAQALENWKSYTIDVIKSVYQGSSTPEVTYSDSKLAFWFKKQVGNTNKYDYFIFLGMNVWNFNSDIFLNADIQFVSNLLNGEASTARCFIFTHPFFPDRAGNFQNLYTISNLLSGSQLATLTNLCDSHPNTIWFSGHSHWKQYLADQDPVSNDYRGLYANIWHEQAGGTGGWTVHVSSCAQPRDAHYDEIQNRWVSDANKDWTSKASEGTVVDVHEDYVDIRAISFKCAWRDGTGDQGYVTHYVPCGAYRVPISAV